MGLWGFLGPFETVFSFVGTLVLVIFVAKVLYFTLKNLYVYYFAELLGQTVNFKSLGEWAVVTGATDGIGKCYALDLARRGCNIVLISRTEAKLRNVAKEIESTYNVRTKIIAADYGGDESIYETIKEGLRNLEVGVLINNVGLGLPDSGPGLFHLMPGGESYYLNLIRVNCVSQALMTRIIIPQMVARGKGVIVHLSSVSGIFPIPLATGYSASKAFNKFMARALHQEYKDKGIINQVIMPFMVATSMSGLKADGYFTLDCKAFCRSCLDTVGFFEYANGHPIHAIQNFFLNLVPEFVQTKVLGQVVVIWGQALATASKEHKLK